MVLKNNIQKQPICYPKAKYSPKNLNAIKTRKNLISKLSNKKINNLFKIFEKNFQIHEGLQ